METNLETIPPATNKLSILSLVFGILTLLFLCLGLLPIPFTSFVCYPICFLLGMLALIFGIISLTQIRRSQETGRPMAWIGILAGGFILLCMLCMIIAIAALLFFAPNLIHLPPSIQNFHI